MKKCICILILAISLLILGACAATQFDGSRTGNDSQLIMKYKILNKTDSQVLELQKGDYIDITVVRASGEVDILVQQEGEDPVYRGVDVPTSSFGVGIKESGSYIVSVTGKKARGSVSAVKR